MSWSYQMAASLFPSRRSSSMTVPRLTLRNVELRALSVPLKRPIVSKVGLFDRWPLILIDLHTEEGIVGRSYLEPYLETIGALPHPRHSRPGGDAQGPTDSSVRRFRNGARST